MKTTKNQYMATALLLIAITTGFYAGYIGFGYTPTTKPTAPTGQYTLQLQNAVLAPPQAMYVDNQLAADCVGTYSIANRDCSGSDGDAYNTPQKAAAIVEPGDIVYFRAGTYYRHDNLADWADVLTIRRSGTPDNPITFKNYNNEEVILSGMRPEDKGHRHVISLGSEPSIFKDISGQGVQNIIIDGFIIEGASKRGIAIYGPANKNGPAENPTENIIVRNIIGRNGGRIETLGRVVNVVIEYCELHHTGTAIQFGYLSTDFHGPEPEDDMDAAHNCVVRNCLVHDNVDEPPGGTDGINAGYAYRCTFEDNVVWHNSDDGIDMMVSYEGTIKNNISFNNGVGEGNGCGVKFSARGGGRHTITGNVVISNSKLGIEGSQPGIRNQWKEYYPSRVYGNLAYKSGESGFSLGTGEGYITSYPGFEKTDFMNNLALNNTDDIYGGYPGTTNSNYNFFSSAAELTTRQEWGLDAHSLTGDPGLVNKNLVIDTSFGSGWTIEQKLEYIRNQVKAAFSLTPKSQLIDKGTIIAGYHCSTVGAHSGENCREWYGTAPDTGAYEYLSGETTQCSGIDTSCGSYPNCINCNSQDTCVGNSYRNYRCQNNTCTYTDDNCTDCSCTCGAYNQVETIANNNCADGKDNDCDGSMDSADSGCQAIECVDNAKLLSYISQWKQGNITMIALMQKILAWKAGC